MRASAYAGGVSAVVARLNSPHVTSHCDWLLRLLLCEYFDERHGEHLRHIDKVQWALPLMLSLAVFGWRDGSQMGEAAFLAIDVMISQSHSNRVRCAARSPLQCG